MERKEPQFYVFDEDYVEDWDDRSRQTRNRQERNIGEGNQRRAQSQRTGQGQRTVQSQRAGQSQRMEQSQRQNRRQETVLDERERSSKKKRRKRKGFGIKKFLCGFFFVAILLAAGLYVFAGVVYSKLNYSEVPELTGAPFKEDGVINVLLIGNDSRENGEDGRSDAMILLSISSKTGKICMTSLLRDMYVDIPDHKGNRLNAAYSYGGPKLLLETIEKNLGIEVNRYMLVNFEAFASLVDAVGGVDLELTEKEVEYVNGYLVEYNILTNRPQGTDNLDTSISGMVHLNGPQALAYSRNRYLGTDFGRTERQRKVLNEVIHKLPKAALTNSKELLNGLLPNLTTNMTKGECIRAALTTASLLTGKIEQSSIPIEGTYKNSVIRKMDVLEVDFAANEAYLKELLYGE